DPVRRTPETCTARGCALSGGSMAATRPRPLSPHLTIWRWGPHMVVSILHRATGAALSIAGLAILTWSFFQHLLSGIRHLVTDTGAAFELGVNRTFAVLTIVGSIVLTALLWIW